MAMPESRSLAQVGDLRQSYQPTRNFRTRGRTVMDEPRLLNPRPLAKFVVTRDGGFTTGLRISHLLNIRTGALLAVSNLQTQEQNEISKAAVALRGGGTMGSRRSHFCEFVRASPGGAKQPGVEMTAHISKVDIEATRTRFGPILSNQLRREFFGNRERRSRAEVGTDANH